jgi:hypothetical protein
MTSGDTHSGAGAREEKKANPIVDGIFRDEKGNGG